MVTLTEGKHEGEFIGELALGPGFHIDEIIVLSGEDLPAGQTLGRLTANKKFVAFDNAGTDDGRRTLDGILVAAVNATGGDKKGKALRRGPGTINKNDLTWAAGIDATEQAAALEALLESKGIKAT